MLLFMTELLFVNHQNNEGQGTSNFNMVMQRQHYIVDDLFALCFVFSLEKYFQARFIFFFYYTFHLALLFCLILFIIINSELLLFLLISHE